MVCKKCGSEIKETQLFCLECGMVNLDNPNNALLQKMAEESIAEDNKKTSNFSKLVSKARESKLVFTLVNLLVYVLLIILAINKTAGSNWSGWFVCFAVSFFYFYVICYQVLAKKAGFCWWGILTPFYNLYLLFKIALKKGYLCITFLLPLFSFLYKDVLSFIQLGLFALILSWFLLILIIFIILFFTGKRFGRNGFITVIFFFVIIPSIAFNKKYQYH
ncbi:MAG: zinc-ribbon domain-containing protein [Bacilli bacterium]|nr:zinc-ribbon domain-containing protein [Bacilli bacterium]